MSHPILARLRDADPGVRRAACEQVPQDPAAVLLLDGLCEALGDPDRSVARAASDALVSLRDHLEAVKTALSAVLRSELPRRRFRSALTFARLEPPPIKLLPALVDALEQGDPDVRWMATRSLVDMGRLHGEVLQLLLRLAEDDERPAVRRMAIHAIRELAPDLPETAHTLLAGTRDPDPGLRRAAISALAGLVAPPHQVEQRLVEIRDGDSDPPSRRAAERALVALGLDSASTGRGGADAS